MDEVIRVEGLTKNFGSLRVLRGIDCTVSASEVVCVIGPSGSGKSTFLRCLNGLEEASGGRVLVVNAVARRHREYAVVLPPRATLPKLQLPRLPRLSSGL